ncbi:kappa-scoloptoxin(11)-Ssd1b-like [Odontomachus brunneus]|uniref:kappa-scoloptoxin(11)-Ssd1b-like n=1 Tax=Odontomachus brunneus TaxID=486640 RepID=UPI0013F2080B|nr:kappa-scoloptoxin(11)-Ssd1b-like [Odontomachus brunneus]
MFIRICLFISAINAVVSVYTTISSKANNVTFKYMKGVQGESDLHLCESHEVCNVVHNRFWMSGLTERLCRCTDGRECPWQWTKTLDSSSAILNNRSVLKFCTQIVELETCAHKQDAVIVHGEGNTSNSYIIPYNATVNCKCPQTHYWKLQQYTYEQYGLVQVFRCVKKRRCETLDFCGYIRADLYSTYYRCTCPEKHLCIFKDKIKVNVQELLYSGPAYMAYCYRS